MIFDGIVKPQCGYTNWQMVVHAFFGHHSHLSELFVLMTICHQHRPHPPCRLLMTTAHVSHHSFRFRPASLLLPSISQVRSTKCNHSGVFCLFIDKLLWTTRWHLSKWFMLSLTCSTDLTGRQFKFSYLDDRRPLSFVLIFAITCFSRFGDGVFMEVADISFVYE